LTKVNSFIEKFKKKELEMKTDLEEARKFGKNYWNSIIISSSKEKVWNVGY